MSSALTDINLPRIDLERSPNSDVHLISRIQDALDSQGCIIIENAVDTLFIDSANAMINASLASIGYDYPCNSHEVTEILRNNKHVQSTLYDNLIYMPLKNELFLASSRIRSISHALFNNPVLYEKSPLRIDVPYDLSEMTLWHQDYFYVKGNMQVLTLYIPLNDLDYLGGALSVCPGSHCAGPLPHCLNWGKKSYPENTGVFGSVCCELKAGSALVFNSLLLHQTNPNLSEYVNFNIQYRIADKMNRHNPKMGKLIPIPAPN
jgi:ectoine hydroxylase-related dioxygenase (phytanoyl-CoA dioxygenase family)